MQRCYKLYVLIVLISLLAACKSSEEQIAEQLIEETKPLPEALSAVEPGAGSFVSSPVCVCAWFYMWELLEPGDGNRYLSGLRNYELSIDGQPLERPDHQMSIDVAIWRYSGDDYASSASDYASCWK